MERRQSRLVRIQREKTNRNCFSQEKDSSLLVEDRIRQTKCLVLLSRSKYVNCVFEEKKGFEFEGTDFSKLDDQQDSIFCGHLSQKVHLELVPMETNAPIEKNV